MPCSTCLFTLTTRFLSEPVANYGRRQSERTSSPRLEVFSILFQRVSHDHRRQRDDRRHAEAYANNDDAQNPANFWRCHWGTPLYLLKNSSIRRETREA